MIQNETKEEMISRKAKEMHNSRKHGGKPDSRIMPSSIILGKNLKQGCSSYIGHFCMIDATNILEIGDNTMIDDYVCIKTHGHETKPPFKYFSINKLAIGAAHSPPLPTFSTYTARAILGLSIGANAKKPE